ncbi:MAG: amidohydrolase [Bacteroidetes bacterium]|nr:amidohydrolase [Bacteroidota bacterium]
MNKKLTLAGFFLLISTLFSCHIQRHVDTIVFNGKIYTVDNGFSVVEAMAIKNGKIVSIGSTEDMLYDYSADEKIDLKGNTAYPGFIDAHCHFYGYATDLTKCNLTGTSSYSELIGQLTEFAKTNKFTWLLGRGWDQNDWEVKEYPNNHELDSLFPTLPVFLMRIDGHAALCNSAALKLAGIDENTKIDGGEILKKDGKLTGVVIDHAMEQVFSKIPPFSSDIVESSILKAQQNCFEVGLTTVDDAGLGKDSIFTLHKLQKEDKLRLRIYAMISDDPVTLNHFIEHGPFKSDRLNVRAIKIYADGSLGSRGACMKADYADLPGHKGFLLHPASYFVKIADEAIENGFQLCTHAIGDSAVKITLAFYDAHLNGENNRRWRIEHCQVVSEADRKRLGTNNIIPSVQPTHATSDMYWAEDRIGKDRIKEAYAYKDLLDDAGGIIAFGTDFPVEGINPINTFYAAVARKDLKGFPENGFQIDNKIKKKDALRAMTIWAAYSNFEEEEKGSLEQGKFADFVILDTDIMKCDENKIPATKVLATFVNGERVFSRGF